MAERVSGRIGKDALAEIFARADRLVGRAESGIGPSGRLGKALLDELLARASVVQRDRQAAPPPPVRRPRAPARVEPPGAGAPSQPIEAEPRRPDRPPADELAEATQGPPPAAQAGGDTGSPTLEQVSAFLAGSSEEDAAGRTFVEELEMPDPAQEELEEVVTAASEVRFEGDEEDLRQLLLETYQRYRAAPTALARPPARRTEPPAPPAPLPSLAPPPATPPPTAPVTPPVTPPVDPFALDPFTGAPPTPTARPPAERAPVADPFALDPFTGQPLTRGAAGAGAAAAPPPSKVGAGDDPFLDPYTRAALDPPQPTGDDTRTAARSAPPAPEGSDPLGALAQDAGTWGGGSSWAPATGAGALERAYGEPAAFDPWEAPGSASEPDADVLRLGDSGEGGGRGSPPIPGAHTVLRAFHSALLAHALHGMLERKAPAAGEPPSAPVQLLYDGARDLYQAPLRPRLEVGDKFQLSDRRLFRITACEVVFVQGVACYQEARAAHLGRLEIPLRDSWEGHL